MTDIATAPRPKVSVIVLAYNQQATIGRTLDSILAQQCDFPFEIIVGEDCSTDATLAVCRRYVDSHPQIVRLIANSRNKGLIDNYFDCLLQARGEYIADCGGDDFWTDSNKIRLQAELLDAHHEVALVHTDWSYFDEPTATLRPSDPDGHRASVRKPMSAPGELLSAIISQKGGESVVHLCTAMFRRDMMMSCYEADTDLFRSRTTPCEDLPIVASLAACGAIAYLPQQTMAYSVGKPSIMSPGSHVKLCQFYIKSLATQRRLQLKHSIPDREMDYGRRLHYTLWLAYRSRDYSLVKRVVGLYESLSLSPTVKARIYMVISCLRSWMSC